MRRWNALWGEDAILTTVGKSAGIFIAFFMAYVLSKNEYNEAADLDPALPRQIQLVCLAALAYPVVFNLIFYKAKTDLIPKIFPVSAREKTFAEFCYDLTEAEYLAVAVFGLSLFLFAPFFKLYYLSSFLGSVVFVCLLINICKILIERRLSVTPGQIGGLTLLTLVLTVGAFYVKPFYLVFPYYLPAILAEAAIYFFVLAYLERYAETRSVDLSGFGIFRTMPALTKVVFGRKEIIKMLILFAILKIGMLAYVAAAIDGEAAGVKTIRNYFYFIFMTGSFSYVSNVFGYIREPWLLIHNNALERHPGRDFCRPFRNLTLLWSFSDLAVMLVWLALIKISDWEVYLFFIWVSLFNYGAGFLLSVNRPFYYKNQNKFALKNFTLNISLFMAIFLFLSPLWNPWFYWLYSLTALIFIYLYRKTPGWIAKNKYAHFDQLFS